MNLLHSIKALGLDNLINAIIEIPIGSKSKMEYDSDKGEFVLDRILQTELTYPFNYGFIPETWNEDNDPLDVVVLSSKSIPTGTVVESRMVGVLATTDQDGQDSKIIAIPVSENVDTLSEETKDKIEYFYKNYKINESGKWVDINGFFSKKEAETILSEAIKRYHQHFQK